MQLRFGAHRVGLQTGDGSLNIGQPAWLYGACVALTHTACLAAAWLVLHCLTMSV